MNTQQAKKLTVLKGMQPAVAQLLPRRHHWQSSPGVWQRANLVRSFLWTQDLSDEKVLLTQFLARLRRLFAVDFCFAAVQQEGAKRLEVGLPEAACLRLPANFTGRCLDSVANARLPIVPKGPHGVSHYCSSVISPLSPAVGQPLGFLMMGHSTPRSFAAADLLLVRSLAGDLSWAMRDLRARNNRQKLLASVSRELKNPIHRIVNNSVFLHEELARARSKREREQFGRLETSARELLDLVNGLGGVGGAHAGHFGVVEAPMAVAPTLEEIFATYRKTARKTGRKFEARLAQDLPATMVTDPVKFREMVHSLIASATAFSQTGDVAVNVRRNREMLEIIAKEKKVDAAVDCPCTAHGTGAPMDSGLQDGVRSGTGLGLVTQYAELLKGHVHTRREPGRGSEITVCLPCV